VRRGGDAVLEGSGNLRAQDKKRAA
jgi:hypothetical protein